MLRAIQTAAEQLARMPASPEVEALKSAARAFEKEVEGWAEAPPSGEDRETMMKKAMAPQVALARLARRREET